MLNDYLESMEKNKCYGCSACEKFCPHHAITMKEDEHGFQYPSINKEACIQCGKCRQVCPIHMESTAYQVNTFYVMEHKDDEVAKSSQSGGAFTAISDCILNLGGVVYGAIINENLAVEHVRADTQESRNAMRGSKYVQSILTSTIIEQLETDLRDGKRVLFTGTPCQCAMITKNYSGYDNLFVCDFICHGVPSPKVWKDYLADCSNKLGSDIANAIFRNKKYLKKGWHSESLFTANKEEYISNEYAALFYSHLFHRNTCFSCQFASLSRYSDITFGGFLDHNLITFDEKYDSSMCFINTAKGTQLFTEFRDHVKYKECKMQYFKNQPCLYHPIEKPDTSEQAWSEYLTHGFDYILSKYATPELKKKYHLDINS